MVTQSATSVLAGRALSIRRTVLEMCRGRGQGYAGQGLALADLMACLYFNELRSVDSPPDPAGNNAMNFLFRDHFLLSTGHSAIAPFAVGASPEASLRFKIRDVDVVLEPSATTSGDDFAETVGKRLKRRGYSRGPTSPSPVAGFAEGRPLPIGW